MHDARTHGHISAESSSETLRHTQVSGTETRPVNPAQNTDHELIYQRAAVSQPSMQNDVSMAPISTRIQYMLAFGSHVQHPFPSNPENPQKTLNLYLVVTYHWTGLRGSAVYCILVLIGAMETSFCMLGCETAALW
jgi:hypothetical protein